MGKPPVDSETRARAIELMHEGKSRNAIAKECKVAGSTITGIAQSVGFEFDRRNTELAVAARTVDLAEARAELAKMMMIEARQALEDIHNPVTIVQWASGTDHQAGGWKSKVLPEPTASDKRNLMTIAGIAISKMGELTKSAAVEGTPESLAWMDNLAEVLVEVREKLAPADMDPSTDPTVDPAKVTREDLLAEYSQDEPDRGTE